jgi:hypothetical protein
VHKRSLSSALAFGSEIEFVAADSLLTRFGASVAAAWRVILECERTGTIGCGRFNERRYLECGSTSSFLSAQAAKLDGEKALRELLKSISNERKEA